MLILVQQASAVAGRALVFKNIQHLVSFFSRAIVALGQQVSSALFAAIIFVWQALSLQGDLWLQNLIS